MAISVTFASRVYLVLMGIMGVLMVFSAVAVAVPTLWFRSDGLFTESDPSFELSVCRGLVVGGLAVISLGILLECMWVMRTSFSNRAFVVLHLLIVIACICGFVGCFASFGQMKTKEDTNRNAGPLGISAAACFLVIGVIASFVAMSCNGLFRCLNALTQQADFTPDEVVHQTRQNVRWFGFPVLQKCCQVRTDGSSLEMVDTNPSVVKELAEASVDLSVAPSKIRRTLKADRKGKVSGDVPVGYQLVSRGDSPSGSGLIQSVLDCGEGDPRGRAPRLPTIEEEESVTTQSYEALAASEQSSASNLNDVRPTYSGARLTNSHAKLTSHTQENLEQDTKTVSQGQEGHENDWKDKVAVETSASSEKPQETHSSGKQTAHTGNPSEDELTSCGRSSSKIRSQGGSKQVAQTEQQQ